MIAIGIDPGFGNFKIADAEGRVAALPSTVGVGEIAPALETGLGRRRREASRLPDRVRLGNLSYLAGEVERYARPADRLDMDRFGGGPEMEALLLAAAFRLLGEGEFEAAASVGLPVHVLRAPDAAETVASVRRWLIGEHRGEVNGRPFALRIRAVRVLAQPLGAFFAWGLDGSGRWARPAADFKARVAVIDVGFNTLDIFAIEAGEVIQRFTQGGTVGVRRAAERLADLMRAQRGWAPSLREADAWLRGNGEEEISRQALETAASEIVTFCEQALGDTAPLLRAVLLTGGGVAFAPIRERLMRRFPNAVVPADPVTANALGLARFAVRLIRERKDGPAGAEA
jgi:hypothetical protein